MTKLKINTLLSRMVIALLAFFPMVGSAAEFDGAQLPLVWGIPFVGILLSIALFPLFASVIWHHHYGKIIIGWTLLFIIPFLIVFGIDQTLTITFHAILEEYIPFILLLLSLFTVSGGILINGNLVGTPKFNVILLAIGTVLASLMGTTGAAMLMIRPLLKANRERAHRVHTVIFFIFLVANIGGGLTPLGDPPLFIGFLKGVDFLWTVEHMLLPVLLNSVILLAIFYFIDSMLYKKEGFKATKEPMNIKLYGKQNFLLLIAIVATVLMSGVWQSSVSVTIFGVTLYLQEITRDILFIAITFLSLFITPKQVRYGNEFNWEPILEVAKLFIGIFITIAPVIAILKAGNEGALSSIVALVSNEAGEPNNVMYFWLTGLFSGFLDNAPTYLVFFNLASGDAVTMMTQHGVTLLAISMGSVFMGALTYIGNAPNFMVKSIADQAGIKMPSFFGYMKWSVGILIPIFILDTFIFFVLQVI